MMTDRLGVLAPQEANGVSISFPPPCTVRGVYTSQCLHETSLLPAKMCQALSSVSCETPHNYLLYAHLKKIHIREMKVLYLPDAFFFVISLLPPHHRFLGFCLFHRVCLPLMAKPEGKTHNLAKSFQSIYLPPTLMVYS